MSDRDDIEGRSGAVSGKYGGISGGGFSGVAGKYGGISGGPHDMIERALVEGRLMDEIDFLRVRVRRLENDLLGIAGTLSDRLGDLEGRLSSTKLTVNKDTTSTSTSTTTPPAVPHV